MMLYIPENGLISTKELLEWIGTNQCKLPINYVKGKKTCYYNIPCAFDIETSSFYQNGEKKAIMYAWGFGIFNKVVLGRTWNELVILLEAISLLLHLNKDKRLICYVHNLAYDFQFFRKHFNWDNVFIMKEHEPLYAITNGIEFRCSYKLSGKSLLKIGNDLVKYPISKKAGDLDYQVVRTPLTPLTEKEKGYIENDIRVVLHFIQETLERDGGTAEIPLTKTGYVRNLCRKNCFKTKKMRHDYQNFISKLAINEQEYDQLKRAFAGGFTHANAMYTDRTVNGADSDDICSSYPSQLLLEKFPMSPASYIGDCDIQKFEFLRHHYCTICDVLFINLQCVQHESTLSSSKAWLKKDYISNNGRVFYAKCLGITLTNVDFAYLKDFYTWDVIVIRNLRIYTPGYLPKSLAESILTIYKDKTTLKGVKGKEVDYLLTKEMLNSIYGMCVTDPIRESIEYIENEYTKTPPNRIELLDKYNNSKRRFLFYPWGVWTTAYGRRAVFSAILAIGEDYIYTDTDSIKYKNRDKHLNYFKGYNEIIIQKISDSAKHYHFPEDYYAPLTSKGEKKIIGIWEHEEHYEQFKTLGAKRYLVKTKNGYELTNAGLSKEKAVNYLISLGNPFKVYADGIEIPADFSGRLTHTYFDKPISGTVTDFMGISYDYNELSYIHMEPTTYTMDRSAEYIYFINKIINIVMED